MTKKDTKQQWLFFSLFYPQEQWYSLLQQAVIPFLQSLQPGLQQYIVHFGYDKGAQVGVSCLVSSLERRAFIKAFEKYFSTYLSAFPDNDDGHKVQKHDQVYMNMPVNTICHSLHHYLPGDAGFDTQYQKLWHDSTQQLFTVFGQSPFDREDLFTAGLYLSLLVLLDAPEYSRTYISNDTYHAGREHFENGYASEYERMRGLLKEIFDDCLSVYYGRSNPDLQTITIWSLLLRNYLLQFKADPLYVQHNRLQALISDLYKQLGLVSDGTGIIHYFVSSLLREHYQAVAPATSHHS